MEVEVEGRLCGEGVGIGGVLLVSLRSTSGGCVRVIGHIDVYDRAIFYVVMVRCEHAV